MTDHYPIYSGLAISLGALRREYAPIFTAGVNDLEVTRGVLMRPPIILEQEYPWFEKPADEKNIVFAILLQEKDASGAMTGYRYIGNTALHGLTWPNGMATTGSIIVDKTLFGKGYGTEAKLLLLYDAFRNRGLRKVCSNVKAFNGNSWGHLLVCGYREVGRRKQHHFSAGTFVDEIIFEVFRDEWEPIWEKYQQTKTLPRLTEEQRAYLKKETDI
jgi:RimJ/RimL family protein N-acetyltransferase